VGLTAPLAPWGYVPQVSGIYSNRIYSIRIHSAHLNDEVIINTQQMNRYTLHFMVWTKWAILSAYEHPDRQCAYSHAFSLPTKQPAGFLSPWLQLASRSA